MDSPSPLPDLLERLGMLLQSERRRAAARHGLSEVHLAILDYLARCNRFSNTPLAVSEYLGITKGTISQSIKRLQARGLLDKRPDPEDRRVVHLTLTPAGAALLQVGQNGIWQRALKAMPEAEVVQASRTLRALLRQLQREGGYRGFAPCRTCRHLQRDAQGARCGLTQQPLSGEDLQKICREHEPAAQPA